MIDKQYQYALCEIRTKDNDLIAKGKIVLVGSDFLEISNDVCAASLLRYQHKIKVMINHPFLPSKEVEGVIYIPSFDFFRIIDVKAVMEKEQRSYFRVNVMPEAKAGIGSPQKRHDPVTIVDLSLNGALVRSQAAWDVKTKIEVSVEINNRNIALEGIVCRVSKNEDGSSAYGISFEPLDDNTANTICQFLFKKQKEALKFKKT